MKILAIETSCDETAVALYDGEKGLLGQQIYSQIDIHKNYGGVVPELASRDHIRKILPLINDVLSREPRQYGAGHAKDLTSQQHRASNTLHPDAIAYTKGPGLVGALMVGATLAHSLAYAWNIPVLGVHHIEAHLMAVMLEENKPSYPFLSLIISGGHTMLMQVNTFGDYQLLGQTLDDAVGEAFDKTATLLGLSYPGGPELARLAEQGNPKRFTFPRPMTDRPGLDFSFSGLKTFAMNCIKKNPNARVDIACAFEDAVVDTLRIKCQRALEQTGLNQLVVAGGVSANKKLRYVLKETMSVEVFFPRHEFCTDNAAMVAYTGYERLSRGERDGLQIEVKSRWGL